MTTLSNPTSWCWYYFSLNNISLNNSHTSIDFTMALKENGRLPCLGMEVTKNGCSLNTKVYKKPTDSGLLSHYLSHVDGRYKRSLLNTMLNCAFKLSLHLQGSFFTRDVNAWKRPLLDYATQIFLCSLPSANSSSQKCLRLTYATIWEARSSNRIVLLFKDQKSANTVRKQLGDLNRKVKVVISPEYTSQKIKDEIKVREDKPPLVNL